MKTKPFSIKLISFLLLLAPIVTIVQLAWTNNWPYFGVRSVFWRFSQQEWLTFASYPLVALGVFSVRRWGYFAFLGLTGFQVFKNGYAYYLTPSYTHYLVVLAQLSSMGIMGFFLRKHIIAPYFNPSLRWWVRSPRHDISLDAQVRIDDKPYECTILDVSLTGCFADIRQKLNLEDLVWLHLSLNKMDFSIMGKVVRVSEKNPKGYGLMFLGMGDTEKKSLQRIIDHLLKVSRQAPDAKVA